MEIRGKNITITPMKLKDIYSMTDWGKHDNPLFFDYNLPPLTLEEIEEWYHYKTRKSNDRYYNVFNQEDRLIGYIGIKSIRRLWKDSILGIVLDPNYINQGYGKEILATYLEYYFNEMKMKTMYLEVAKYNKRGISCYQKVGFEVIDQYLDLFFDQKIDITDEYFAKENSSFKIVDQNIYNYIYKMKIDKKTFKMSKL